MPDILMQLTPHVEQGAALRLGSLCHCRNHSDAITGMKEESMEATREQVLFSGAAQWLQKQKDSLPFSIPCFED